MSFRSDPMSHLDVPRLHFAGRFRADPSTVDNSLSRYDPAVVLGKDNVGWNPQGGHGFRIFDATVTRGVDAGGRVVEAASGDLAIAGLVRSTDDPTEAKIVDLDPDQAYLSQIYGLRINVATADGLGGVVGRLRAPVLNDFWRRWPGSVGPTGLSGTYQSVLEALTWTGLDGSPLLRALQTVSGDRLALKFVVDGYHADHTGRVVGTIGPAFPGEPERFVAARRLRPIGGAFGPGFGRHDPARGRLVLDLANALPNSSAGGPPPDGARVTVSLRDPTAPAASALGLPAGFVVLGSFLFDAEASESAGGVVELPLDAGQAPLMATRPLTLWFSTAAGPPARALEEDATGLYVDVEPPLLRLNPGESAAVTLTALRFGAPAEGVALDLGAIAKDHMGIPAEALRFPGRVTTDARGRAEAVFQAAAPVGKPDARRHIDGQIYYVGGPWQAFGAVNQPQGGGAITILVFDDFQPPARPTWDDIAPIFNHYARLFPMMKALLDLSDYDAVSSSAESLNDMLSLPFEDPRYMPVVRDLSANKRAMILQWLRAGAPKE